MKTRNDIATPTILVTGGTGTLGRLVVDRLREAGQNVRVLSRAKPAGAPVADGVEYVAADLASGEGVEAAVEGADVIVHLAGSFKGDAAKAEHLVRAAQKAGTRHLVYISVVGADRIPVRSAIDRAMFGYFAEKHAAEQVIAESGVPWSIVRATQFNALTLKTVEGMAKMPIVPVPAGWKLQPIDASEVADRVTELALGAPAGLVPAIGGPRTYEMKELVESYLRAIGTRRPILSLPLPGGANRAYRAGANLAPDRAVGRRTWEEFLDERVTRSRERAAAAA